MPVQIVTSNRPLKGISESQEFARMTLNGRPWLFGSETSYRADMAEDYFLAIYINGENPRLNLAFVVNRDRVEERTYRLTSTSQQDSASATIYFTSQKACSYRFRHIIDGELTLTEFNAETRVCRGLFNFTAYNESCDTLNVTRGEFAMAIDR